MNLDYPFAVINERERMNNRLELALFIIFAIIKGLSLWIALQIHFPDAPIESKVMFRRNDIEYFQVFGAASRFQFGEFQIFEEQGKYVDIPLFVKAQPFGLAITMFGIKGLVILDILGTCCYFILLTKFLAIFINSRKICHFLGLVALTIEAAANRLSHQILGFPFVSFWDLRLPNPFAAELVSLACVLFEYHAFKDRIWRGNKLVCFLLLLLFLMCTNFHYFVVHALIIVFFFVRDIYNVELKNNLSVWLKIAFICGGALVYFFGFPADNSHEMAARAGIYPISRFPTFFCQGIISFLVMQSINIWIKFKKIKHCGKTVYELKNDPIIFLTIISIIAYFAMPIFQMVTGKFAQYHNFQYIFERFCGYSLLICLAGMCQLLLNSEILINLKYWLKRHWYMVSLAIILIASFFSIKLAEYDLLRRNHRTGYYNPQIPTYRQDFMDMTKYLDCIITPEDQVLGTFDMKVHSWWLLNHARYVFHPDICFSKLPNEMINERVVTLAKVIGLDDQTFESMLKTVYMTLNWTYGLTYSANKYYTRVPLTNYPKEIRELAEKTSPLGLGCFFAPLPEFEIQRLKRMFQNTYLDKKLPRLDILVITKDEHQKSVLPATSSFSFIYENNSFKIYRRNR